MSPESESRVGIVMGVLALVSTAWMPAHAQTLTVAVPLQLYETASLSVQPFPDELPWSHPDESVATINGAGIAFDASGGSTTPTGGLQMGNQFPIRASTSYATPHLPIANQEVQGCMKGAEVDGIIAEYVSSGLEEPQCEDLKNSGGSEYFSFEQFLPTDYRTPPGHEHGWAWLRQTLLDGLDYTYEGYKSAMSLNSGYQMTLNSGYRCPEKNAAIYNSALKSRHMFGDAVDVRATPAQQKAIIDVTNALYHLQHKTYIHLDWHPR